MTSLLRTVLDSTWAFATGSFPNDPHESAKELPKEPFPIEKLSAPLGRSIQVFLDPRSTARCAGVCKAWKRIADDEAIWNYYHKLLSPYPFDYNKDHSKREQVVSLVATKLPHIRKGEVVLHRNFAVEIGVGHDMRSILSLIWGSKAQQGQSEINKFIKTRDEAFLLYNASKAAIPLSAVGLSSMENAEVYVSRAKEYTDDAMNGIIYEYVRKKQFDKALNLLARQKNYDYGYRIVIVGLHEDGQTDKAKRLYHEKLYPICSFYNYSNWSSIFGHENYPY